MTLELQIAILSLLGLSGLSLILRLINKQQEKPLLFLALFTFFLAAGLGTI